MARWLLVRHGETVWSPAGRYAGHSDIPLSETGRRQARCLATHLAAAHPLTVAYTSDLRRASETLELLLAGGPCRPEVVVSPELRELHFGVWEGLIYAEVAAQQGGAAVLAGSEGAPGGESLAQLSRRLQRFFVQLQQRAGGSTDTALVVTHGGPLRVLLCLLLGLPPEQHWRLQVDYASLTEVAWDAATGARLVHLNERCHLAGGKTKDGRPRRTRDEGRKTKKTKKGERRKTKNHRRPLAIRPWSFVRGLVRGKGGVDACPGGDVAGNGVLGGQESALRRPVPPAAPGRLPGGPVQSAEHGSQLLRHA